MSEPRALLIFAKAPKPGRVKTRLLRAVSEQAAAEIHEACIEDTLQLAQNVTGCELFLFVAGRGKFFTALEKRERGSGISREALHIFSQRGRDLGARLENAFSRTFRRGYRQIVVIGTDTPWMGAARIRTAFAALRRANVVLGPTADGGYYLLGARRFLQELFRGIPWSTRRVWRETLRAVAKARARAVILPRDFDLDRPADLKRARRILRANPKRASHLAEILERICERRSATRGSSRRPGRLRRNRKPRPGRE